MVTRLSNFCMEIIKLQQFPLGLSYIVIIFSYRTLHVFYVCDKIPEALRDFLRKRAERRLPIVIYMKGCGDETGNENIRRNIARTADAARTCVARRLLVHMLHEYYIGGFMTARRRLTNRAV